MTSHSIPRIMISSPASASGKTTVTCALLGLLKGAAAIKCGPDFIDPLFHSRVLGKKTGNVDLFFTDEETAKSIFLHDTRGAEIAVCEGAMGFYDGAGGSEKASAFEIARLLKCPVLLVVDARGKSLSLCAEINGFASFRERNGDRSGICGVILNRCSKSLYDFLAPAIEKECGIKAVGYLEENEAFALESRHLGLVTPDDISDLQKKMEVLFSSAKKTLDIAEIQNIARKARTLEANDVLFTPEQDCLSDKAKKKVRIAVAKDRAFCFYYRENLELLEAMGAELIYFSPLDDKGIPADCSGLYIGGGYPQLFPMQLAENTSMLESLRAFCRTGAPVFAECGGFLYLQLAGILQGTFENKKKLVRFGYITLTAQEDTFFCRRGDTIQAHEFHYFDTTQNGKAFTARKVNGKEWECMQWTSAVKNMHPAGCHASIEKANILAGFPHLYFASNPSFAENFVKAAAAFRADGKKSCGGCSGNMGSADCGGCAGCSGNAGCTGCAGSGACSVGAAFSQKEGCGACGEKNVK